MQISKPIKRGSKRWMAIWRAFSRILTTCVNQYEFTKQARGDIYNGLARILASNFEVIQESTFYIAYDTFSSIFFQKPSLVSFKSFQINTAWYLHNFEVKLLDRISTSCGPYWSILAQSSLENWPAPSLFKSGWNRIIPILFTFHWWLRYTQEIL